MFIFQKEKKTTLEYFSIKIDLAYSDLETAHLEWMNTVENWRFLALYYMKLS